MTFDVTTYEYERGFIDFTLTYGSDWSQAIKHGTPLLQTDVTRVYFYVKPTDATGSPIISLTDASSSQIEWIGPTTGQLRVKLGTNTGGHAGDNQPYELRLKMTDGSYITVVKALLHIKESTVDNP